MNDSEMTPEQRAICAEGYQRMKPAFRNVQPREIEASLKILNKEPMSEREVFLASRMLIKMKRDGTQ